MEHTNKEKQISNRQKSIKNKIITACNEDFYPKMWMNTHIRWKYVECLPVENESTPWRTTYTTCVAHYHVYTEKKLFEFLKYNNICSLTAISNESISKLCGLSPKYAQIWGTVKITPCHIHRVRQIMVLIKEASKTKCPLFYVHIFTKF
jgi:hypothetical protein